MLYTNLTDLQLSSCYILNENPFRVAGVSETDLCSLEQLPTCSPNGIRNSKGPAKYVDPKLIPSKLSKYRNSGEMPSAVMKNCTRIWYLLLAFCRKKHWWAGEHGIESNFLPDNFVSADVLCQALISVDMVRISAFSAVHVYDRNSNLLKLNIDHITYYNYPAILSFSSILKCFTTGKYSRLYRPR